MEKTNKLKQVIILFWVFIIGSVIGYIVEMVVAFVQEGHFESRQGVIYGPFTPIYGIGAIVYYVAFKSIKTRENMNIFLFSMILGGTLEYLCSFMQEKIFGTVSWDYTNLLFNINGRTSLLHCIYWGIAGILYIKYVEPLILKIPDIINIKYVKIATMFIMVFMTFNIMISYMAGVRQKERTNNIPAEDKIDLILDKYYPDEYMNKIFANKKNKYN